MTPDNAIKTPGLYLGMLLGLGTPALVAIWAGAGFLAALGVLAVVIPLVIVFLRRFKREDMVRAYGSEAIMRYNHRFLLATLAYVIGLMIAMSIYSQGSAQNPTPQPVLFAITLLPTLPALAMIFVMGRYLVEETDEYLRHRASLSAIVGLGFVLVSGTVWGFLETFGLVPHVWAWWVVPGWAIGLGIGQAFLSRAEGGRANAEDAEVGEPA